MYVSQDKVIYVKIIYAGNIDFKVMNKITIDIATHQHVVATILNPN